MAKRKASLTVKTDLSGLFNEKPGHKSIVEYPVGRPSQTLYVNYRHLDCGNDV